MIEEYSIWDGEECETCGTDEDVVIDENGSFICTDCLFEATCEKMFCNDEDE